MPFLVLIGPFLVFIGPFEALRSFCRKEEIIELIYKKLQIETSALKQTQCFIKYRE